MMCVRVGRFLLKGIVLFQVWDYRRFTCHFSVFFCLPHVLCQLLFDASGQQKEAAAYRHMFVSRCGSLFRCPGVGEWFLFFFSLWFQRTLSWSGMGMRTTVFLQLFSGGNKTFLSHHLMQRNIFYGVK
ncbi:hypothetical protein BDD12DRAFT_153098 [Trichophaea hybrida]|nr:hypothetical protein BDD12DRAFT_153098 [Trichophaea hybrida]